MSTTPAKPPGQPDAASWAVPSWEQIVREHSPRVYRLAYRLTGNQHDAEDLTQEVFVRVFRSLHTYTPGTFEGWLHRITTNLFLDQARRRQRIRMDPMGEAGERLGAATSSPDELVDDAGLDADVAAALAALPPEYRVCVVLCDIEGLSYEEVAATLGAGPWRRLTRVTLPLVAPGLLSGCVLAFARALGEFGATLTFAGAAQGRTRTLPLEIYLQRETDPDAAVTLALLLVVLATVIVGTVYARTIRPERTT